MNDKGTSQSVIDIIPEAIEKVTAILQKVGIVLPNVLVQAFLLILTLTLFVFLIKKLTKKKKITTIIIIEVVSFGFIAVSILVSWGETLFFPFPDKLSGYIEVSENNHHNYSEMRVSLFDVMGNKISLAEGMVDTINGKFYISYKTNWGVRPYTLRVTTPICAVENYTISRNELRRGSLILSFNCKGK